LQSGVKNKRISPSIDKSADLACSASSVNVSTNGEKI